MLKKILILLLLPLTVCFNCLAQDKETVSAALEQMKERFGVRLVYDSELDSLMRKSYEGGSVEGSSLEKTLEKILHGTGIRWEIHNDYVVLKRCLSFHTVCGYVTDAATGESLIGAAVMAADGRTGVLANNYGFYSLTLPSGETELTYSYIGCSSFKRKILLDKDLKVNVALTPSAELKEARVTARNDDSVRSASLGFIEIPIRLIADAPVVLGEADVLKTIQMMPGVQGVNEGFSGIYVRGGGSDENLILLDGASLYNVSHLFGLLSAFTPEAVKKVTLYKGAFPARYGGRVSSVVDVRTYDGNSKKISGSVSAGLLAEKFHLEGPLKNENTTFSLSARGMHTFLLDRVVKWAGSPMNYAFYDVNAKISRRFSDRSRGWIGLYSGRDYFRYEDGSKTGKRFYGSDYEPYTLISSEEERLGLNWGNDVLTARWTYVCGNKLFGDFTAYINHYGVGIRSVTENSETSELGGSLFRNEGEYSSEIFDSGFKADFDFTPSSNHLIKFGGEYVRHSYRPETISTSVKDVDDNRVFADTTSSDADSRRIIGNEMSVYAEDAISIGGRLTLNPGIHLSLFNVRGRFYFCPEPRFSAEYAVNDNWTVDAAYSRMSQYVHQLTTGSLEIPTDLWVPITAEIRPVTSGIISVGTSFDGLAGWKFNLEGFYKKTDNVLEYVDGRLVFSSSVNWEDNVVMGKGRAYGLEFLARKSIGKTTGFLSYTLSKSDRIFPGSGINNGSWFPARFDRRHSLAVCVTHKFSSRVDVTGVWTFQSGNCMTVPTRSAALITPSGKDVEVEYVSERNNFRLPPTHHLDAGINFRKRKPRGERVWKFSVYNIYGAKNPSWCVYDAYEKEEEWKPAVSKRSFLVFLPSFSYTYKF